MSPTEITVTSPATSQAGIVDITVTTAGGTSATSSADQFQYLSGGNAPIRIGGGSSTGGTPSPVLAPSMVQAVQPTPTLSSRPALPPRPAVAGTTSDEASAGSVGAPSAEPADEMFATWVEARSNMSTTGDLGLGTIGDFVDGVPIVPEVSWPADLLDPVWDYPLPSNSRIGN